MSAVAESPRGLSLRCGNGKCRALLANVTGVPMRLVMMFRPGLFSAIEKMHPKEERHRCRGCGFVNIFHPAALTDSTLDDILS